jgi:type II secretory pathway pseudopilin PulG
MKETIPPLTRTQGFTVIELLVAVSVTALLSGMLLLISTQVLETQSKSTSTIETNQIAQFVLDQVQEDLQCALYRNDGNVWMAISLLNDNENSGGSWVNPSISSNGKSQIDSLRIVGLDWPSEELTDSEIDALGQGPFLESRFGVAGCWLRFFSQSPELDPNAKNHGSARAIGYQILRYGLTGSPSSRAKYQLFRSDVSARNTFEAGYNLHPNDGGYNSSASLTSLDPSDLGTPRIPSSITNPIVTDGTDYSPTSFSLASNIIDFGIRAYHLEENSFGTGNLVQIFPPIDLSSPGNLLAQEFMATSYNTYQTLNNKTFYLFPDVMDVMVRVLSMEGARLVEAFENGSVPNTDNLNWWSIAEEHSEVYIRRIKIYGSGL